MLFKFYNIPLLLFTCLAGQSFSQNSVAPLNQSLTDSISSHKTLEVVVITGNSKPTGIDKCVVLTHVITLEKLQSLAVQNVADVLKFLPNLRIQQDNVLGTAMTMQGISGENVKILINGIPIIGRQNGNIDLSQLNINNVERIEIVEGPLSVQYGTNALAGTINIITKKKPSKNVDLKGSAYYESVGHFNMSTALGWQSNNQSVMISGGRNFFGGWSDKDTSRFQDWKPKIQYFADVNYNLDLGKTKIGYTGNYFNEFILNRGQPRPPYFELAFDDKYNSIRYSNGLNLTHLFDNQINTNIVFSLSHYKRIKNTYSRDLVKLSDVLTENAGDQDTTQFNALSTRGTVSKTYGEKLTVEAGYDVNIETGSGLRIKDTRQQIGDYAAFLSAEWVITEGVTLRPGVRASYNTSYKAPVIPSVHLRWKLNEKWIARASYGRGFRSPSLKELYFYFVDINHNIQGNKNLLAEQSHNVSTSVTYKKVVDKKIFKTETSLFYNDINNLITLAIQTGGLNEYRYINIGKYKTAGGQVYTEVVLNNFSAGVGASVTRSNNIYKDQNYTANTWDARTNLTYRLVKAKMDFNFWFKHTGKQFGYAVNENGQVIPTFVATYNMADVGTSRKIINNLMVLSTGIKNIFNIKSIDSQLVSGAHGNNNGQSPLATGRNFYIKCEISL